MDYKKTVYLDARSYCEGLTNETEIDKVVKEYLEGKVDWSKVASIITEEQNRGQGQTSRERKGPWMKNRTENRNTPKAKLYQYTQKAYDENRKATINKILHGTFALNEKGKVFPDINEVE